jgi:Asp-tRNA(Asn)/Glu-tRNA(Gln) amidotransferase A subunit family amidase
MSDAAHWLQLDGAALAAAVHAGAVTATALVQASLARIGATDGRVNAFIDVLA